MTPAERRALLFLAAAALLGASVRMVRGRDSAPPDTAAERALALQIAAVDSARAADEERERTRAARGKSPKRAAGTAAARPAPRSAPARLRIVDLDEASAALIDSLPGIGPVIASRIVADRDRNGPFGSLEGLQRVKGIGPVMARKLAPHVTFSGRQRPNNAHTGSRSPAQNDSRPVVRRPGR